MAQRVALAVSATFMLAACATIGPPQPPSLELPKPPTDLRASRKGDRVNLTWTIPTMTTDRETIRSLGPTSICRGRGELNSCGTPAGKITTPIPPTKAGASAPKAQGLYTDTVPSQLESDDPSAFITYAVGVLNRDGRAAGLSNQVHVPLARTLPPPRDFRARVAKEGVVLSWVGEIIAVPPAEMQYVYRVYRRAEGSSERVLAGDAPAGVETSFTIIDANIEWQKTYFYHAEAVTVIHRNSSPLDIEGDDTPEIKVFADDVFPPTVPAALQAVYSGPGQKPFIDLVWAPVTDADLAGYNVYRREEGMANPVKLNAELIKAPAYRDENVAPQKKYFYSVSAVDARGNESERSEEASEAVP
ncbi:MAG TPA: fibronectin type III domain-containing protein [Candidatus Sulfotelmatobacter sp.]|nr:fibronectin type III domain-containing protein [Candidatus Sulfotelmatobacter sp.]